MLDPEVAELIVLACRRSQERAALTNGGIADALEANTLFLQAQLGVLQNLLILDDEEKKTYWRMVIQVIQEGKANGAA